MCSTELSAAASSEDPSSTTNGPSTVNLSTTGNGSTIGSISISKMPDTTNRNPNRRSNKPIMEKRRRARINNCLNELKSILLEAMRKDPARHSKLEKADILELTVSHLKSLHQSTSNSISDASNHNARFRAGFSECISEVGRFLTTSVKSEGLATTINTRLLSHLADCLSNGSNVTSGFNLKFEDCASETNNNVNVHHMHHPSRTSSTTAATPTSFNMMSPNTPIISLVPSRLPSGEFAFVVPSFNSSTIQVMSMGSSSSDSNNNHTGFVPSNYHQRLLQQQPMMLSPEVPLELTVSPPTISSAAQSTHLISPVTAYSVGGKNLSGFQNHSGPRQQQQQYQNFHMPPPTAHCHGLNNARQLLARSSGLDYQGQQPLSLVTPKRDEADMSCWRPW